MRAFLQQGGGGGQQQQQQHGGGGQQQPYNEPGFDDVVTWLRNKQLNQGDRDRLYEELDLGGCLDQAGLNAVTSAVDYANQCNVPETGNRQEWQETYRSITGLPRARQWPQDVIITRCMSAALDGQ